MKSFRLFLATVFVATCLSFGAQAAMISLGAIDLIPLGTIDSSTSDKTVVAEEYHSRKKPYIYNYILTGLLDAYTKITFTFAATNVEEAGLISGSLEAFSFKDLFNSPLEPIVSWDRNTWPTLTVSGGDTLTGTLVITNATGMAMNFMAYFMALIHAGCGCGDLTISYRVSSVPLPASVLLFCSALMLLAAFAARKRTLDVL